MWTYIRNEGRLQHAGLKAFEVDGTEDGMGFDLRGATSLATHPHYGVFGQKLGDKKEKQLKTTESDRKDKARGKKTGVHTENGTTFKSHQGLLLVGNCCFR